MEINFTNKIYAEVDSSTTYVTRFFSSVREQPTEAHVFIEEGNEEYHAHVHLKYQVCDENGVPNYKVSTGKLLSLTDEEKSKILDERRKLQESKLSPIEILEQSMTDLEVANLELTKQLSEKSQSVEQDMTDTDIRVLKLEEVEVNGSNS